MVVEIRSEGGEYCMAPLLKVRADGDTGKKIISPTTLILSVFRICGRECMIS